MILLTCGMSPDFFREHDDKPRIFGATQLKKQPSYTKQAFAINRFFSAINRFFFSQLSITLSPTYIGSSWPPKMPVTAITSWYDDRFFKAPKHASDSFARSIAHVFRLVTDHVWLIHICLVGGFNPSEKYESQLGLWHSQDMEK